MIHLLEMVDSFISSIKMYGFPIKMVFPIHIPRDIVIRNIDYSSLFHNGIEIIGYTLYTYYTYLFICIYIYIYE